MHLPRHNRGSSLHHPHEMCQALWRSSLSRAVCCMCFFDEHTHIICTLSATLPGVASSRLDPGAWLRHEFPEFSSAARSRSTHTCTSCWWVKMYRYWRPSSPIALSTWRHGQGPRVSIQSNLASSACLGSARDLTRRPGPQVHTIEIWTRRRPTNTDTTSSLVASIPLGL